jgi:putative PIN family toxin of toxin-antitoxin system
MSEKKDRIILDTNLWISFLINRDFSQLDRVLLANSATLIFSDELLAEFLDVSQRPKLKKYFPESQVGELLEKIHEKAEFVSVTTIVDICRDIKDNFILALAADGNVSHIITGDKDLLVIRKFGKARIQTMAEYLQKK